MSVEADVEIRPATDEDLEAVVELALHLYGEVCHQVPEPEVRATAESLLKERDRFFARLALRAGRPVALITASEESAIYAGGFYGHIQELYVRHEERSAGIGRLLLQELQHIGNSRGWSRVEVTAAKDSPRALAFYLSNGFEKTGPRLKLPLRSDAAREPR